MLLLSQKFYVLENDTQMGLTLLSLFFFFFKGFTVYLQVISFQAHIWKSSLCEQFASDLDSSWTYLPRWFSDCLQHVSLINSSQNAHARSHGHCRKSHYSDLNPIWLREFFQNSFFHLLQSPPQLTFLGSQPTWLYFGFPFLFCTFIHSIINKYFLSSYSEPRHSVNC